MHLRGRTDEKLVFTLSSDEDPHAAPGLAGSSTMGIPASMVCKILMFMWSFGPEYSHAPLGVEVAYCYLLKRSK